MLLVIARKERPTISSVYARNLLRNKMCSSNVSFKTDRPPPMINYEKATSICSNWRVSCMPGFGGWESLTADDFSSKTHAHEILPVLAAAGVVSPSAVTDVAGPVSAVEAGTSVVVGSFL